MKNFVQIGLNITVVAAAAITAGDPILTGKLFGMAVSTVKSGEDVTIVRQGVFEGNKVSAQAWTVGAKIYWDDAAKLFTTTATSNTLVGAAVAVAANPTATGQVLLDGAIR